MKKLALVVCSIILSVVLTSPSFAEPVFSKASATDDLPYRFGSTAGLEIPRPVQLDRERQIANLTVAGPPEVEAYWVGANRWMRGVDFGGSFFGSVQLGEGFFGSTLGPNDYLPVEIVFSTTIQTLCQTFRRDPNPSSYLPSGVGTFPGYAQDVSDPLNPRRLNICFVEDANIGNADLTWNPSSSGVGGREYVFIMDSDYDGTGLSYGSGPSIYWDGGTFDVQYGWWPLMEAGETLLGTLPASLVITPHFVQSFRAIPGDGQLTLTWNYIEPGADEFCVYGGTTSPPTNLIVCVGGGVTEWTQTGLTNGVEMFYKIEVLDVSDNLLEAGPILSASAGSVSSNLNLLGYWNGRRKYGDCWGYTEAGTGHEYALICARDEGISIIDIEVSPMVEVGFIPSIQPGNDAKDVKIYDHYAIVLKEYEPLEIVDIADVTNPVVVSQIQPDGTSGAHNCMVDGVYLYIVGNHVMGGLEIYDISVPASPSFVSDFQPIYYHDLDIYGNLLAAAGIYGDGIDLIDISNKSAPVLIERFNYAGSGAHNTEFSADGQTLFVGDEIGTAGNHFRVFDISTTSDVTLLYNMIVNPDAIAHNCYQKDGLLYMAHYTEGLRVWDISDPTLPFEVAFYDSFQPDEFGYQGNWSVYPYFASGKIVMSDMQTGLYVVELALPSESCCDARVGDANSSGEDEPTIGDISVMIDAKFISGTCVGILNCLEEADINQSGSVTPDCDEITIGDISTLIDYLFITGPSLGLPDCL